MEMYRTSKSVNHRPQLLLQLPSTRQTQLPALCLSILFPVQRKRINNQIASQARRAAIVQEWGWGWEQVKTTKVYR